MSLGVKASHCLLHRRSSTTLCLKKILLTLGVKQVYCFSSFIPNGWLCRVKERPTAKVLLVQCILVTGVTFEVGPLDRVFPWAVRACERKPQLAHSSLATYYAHISRVISSTVPLRIPLISGFVPPRLKRSWQFTKPTTPTKWARWTLSRQVRWKMGFHVEGESVCMRVYFLNCMLPP